MGIPLYFKNIINDFPDIISPNDTFHQEINYLLDLNCAIHPCCAGLTK